MAERTIDNPQVPEWVIFANARRICKRQYQRTPNWSLAMEIFGLGSTWAYALCRRIGADPDGFNFHSPKLTTHFRPLPTPGEPDER